VTPLRCLHQWKRISFPSGHFGATVCPTTTTEEIILEYSVEKNCNDVPRSLGLTTYTRNGFTEIEVHLWRWTLLVSIRA
jgi:hypothetical protein